MNCQSRNIKGFYKLDPAPLSPTTGRSPKLKLHSYEDNIRENEVILITEMPHCGA